MSSRFELFWIISFDANSCILSFRKNCWANLPIFHRENIIQTEVNSTRRFSHILKNFFTRNSLENGQRFLAQNWTSVSGEHDSTDIIFFGIRNFIFSWSFHNDILNVAYIRLNDTCKFTCNRKIQSKASKMQFLFQYKPQDEEEE